jgi:hypothetical protein
MLGPRRPCDPGRVVARPEEGSVSFKEPGSNEEHRGQSRQEGVQEQAANNRLPQPL